MRVSSCPRPTPGRSLVPQRPGEPACRRGILVPCPPVSPFVCTLGPPHGVELCTRPTPRASAANLKLSPRDQTQPRGAKRWPLASTQGPSRISGGSTGPCPWRVACPLGRRGLTHCGVGLSQGQEWAVPWWAGPVPRQEGVSHGGPGLFPDRGSPLLKSRSGAAPCDLGATPAQTGMAPPRSWALPVGKALEGSTARSPTVPAAGSEDAKWAPRWATGLSGALSPCSPGAVATRARPRAAAAAPTWAVRGTGSGRAPHCLAAPTMHTAQGTRGTADRTPGPPGPLRPLAAGPRRGARPHCCFLGSRHRGHTWEPRTTCSPPPASCRAREMKCDFTLCPGDDGQLEPGGGVELTAGSGRGPLPSQRLLCVSTLCAPGPVPRVGGTRAHCVPARRHACLRPGPRTEACAHAHPSAPVALSSGLPGGLAHCGGTLVGVETRREAACRGRARLGTGYGSPNPGGRGAQEKPQGTASQERGRRENKARPLPLRGLLRPGHADRLRHPRGGWPGQDTGQLQQTWVRGLGDTHGPVLRQKQSST